MTTTARICLDMLTSARARREEYVGPWLPEPVVDTAALAPDSRTELAEDLSIALLLTLDRLSPLERAADITSTKLSSLHILGKAYASSSPRKWRYSPVRLFTGFLLQVRFGGIFANLRGA